MKKSVLANILAQKLFFIFRDVDNNRLIEIAERLLEHGCNIVEVTYNSHYPVVEQINLLREKFGDKLIIGCGTILDIIELKHILDHSQIDFIVTPHLDTEMLQFANMVDLVTITGALTPTEIMSAHRSGADIIKLFPASLDYIRQIRGPFRHIKIAAVGGITDENAKHYLKAGSNVLGVGSYITNNSLGIDKIDERIVSLINAVK